MHGRVVTAGGGCGPELVCPHTASPFRSGAGVPWLEAPERLGAAGRWVQVARGVSVEDAGAPPRSKSSRLVSPCPRARWLGSAALAEGKCRFSQLSPLAHSPATC